MASPVNFFPDIKVRGYVVLGFIKHYIRRQILNAKESGTISYIFLMENKDRGKALSH
jgi:hypothetical protein